MCFLMKGAVTRFPYGIFIILKAGKGWCFYILQMGSISFISGRESHAFYRKLDELERELEGGGFLRCHKSYLVQERYVRSWKENALWLEDGTEIPISRTYEKAVNRRLMLRME